MGLIKNDVQQWRHGFCEAGLPSSIRATRLMPSCSKRGRWLVAGVVLCGGCKREILKGRT